MDRWAEVVEYYIYRWADIRDIKHLLPRWVG
jgi:hypothetical protein